MRDWRKYLTVFVSLTFFISSVIPVNAGWVDDWLTQQTHVGPTTIEGQKRGYFTAGSFSARWPTSNDKLFTITPPSLKFGCGGIDVFLGGFSFLNFEYLVQKLQRILTAAPAAAFDIAFNQLCEPCSKTIKTLEAVANALNSVQLDDCKMGRALAVEMLSPLAPKALANQKSEADKAFNLWGGLKDLGQKVTDIWVGRGDDPMNNDPGHPETFKPIISEDNKIAGCPDEIKTLMRTGSVLSNLGSQFYIPASHIKLMRGYVGDVDISLEDGEYIPSPVSPCGQNNPQRVEDFLSGHVYEKDGDNCTQITDSSANLYEASDRMIRSVYDAMKNKGTVSADTYDTLSKLPVPVLQAMKVAVASGIDDTAIVSLSDLTARGFGMLIMDDLYNKLAGLIYKAEEIMSKKGKYNMQDCQLELVEPIVESLKPLRNNAYTFARAVRSNFAGSTQEINTIMSLSQRYEQWKNLAYSELTKRFGPTGLRAASLLD